jgi:hypothetical protein
VNEIELIDVGLTLHHERLAEAQRLTEIRRARRENGKPLPRVWLSQHTGRMLRNVGKGLVRLGKRLECGSEPATFSPPHPKAA